MVLTDAPSLGYGIGLNVRIPDKTGQYLQEERYQAAKAAKAQKDDDKTLDDLLKQAKSIDKGRFHQVVLPDVENDVNNTIKDIYSLHQNNPNNYKTQAEGKVFDLINKLRVHDARSQSYFAADKMKRDDLSPEGQRTQDLINESRGKGQQYFQNRMQQEDLVNKSGGYVSAGDQGGITLQTRPKNVRVSDEIAGENKKYQNTMLLKVAPKLGTNKEIEGKWNKIPDNDADKVDLIKTLSKGGVAVAPEDIVTKDDILDGKWKDRNIQDQFRYEHRGEKHTDDELKQMFMDENRKFLGGTYKESTRSLPKPASAKATYTAGGDGSYDSDAFSVQPKEVNIENKPYTAAKLGFVITRKGADGNAKFSDVSSPYALDSEGKIIPKSTGTYNGNIREVVPVKNPLTGRFELFAKMTEPDRTIGTESKRVVGKVSHMPIGNVSKKIIDKGQTIYVPYDDIEGNVAQTIKGATTPKKVGGEGWAVPQSVKDELDKLNGSSPAKASAPKASSAKVSEVERKTKDGKIAIFDGATKKFLRYK